MTTAGFVVPPRPPGLQALTRAPTFTVVVAARDAAPTVGAAVESALGQTLPPLEVVVVDDGSADGTADAAEAAGARVLRRAAGGPAAARNAGFRAAAGEFVSILDADDTYEPRRLERIGDLAAERPDLDVITTDALLVLDGAIVRRQYGEHWTFPAGDQRAEILRRNFVFGLAAARRERVLDAGGMDETWPVNPFAEDWDLWLRLILSGSSAGLVAEPLARQTLRRTSLSAQREGRLLGRLAVLDKAAGAPGLDRRERRIVHEGRARHRADLALERARQAVERGAPGARRRALAVLLQPPSSKAALRPRSRLRALAWLAAPGRFRSGPGGSAWVGPGGMTLDGGTAPDGDGGG